MENNIYEIKIGFDKNNNNPVLILEAIAEILKGFESINQVISNSMDNDIEAVSYLVDINSGSIILKLKDMIKNKLENIDDDVLKNIAKSKDLIGILCVKAKQAGIKALSNNKDKTNKEKEKAILTSIEVILKNSNINFLNYYPINSKQILKAFSDISNGSKKIENFETEFIYGNNTIDISKNYNFIDTEIINETMKQEIDVNLLVRKPDYVGFSKWGFIFDKNIEVEIKDEEFRAKVHSGEIKNLYAGCQIHCKLLIEVELDDKKNPIDTKYFLLKVINIIEPKKNIEKTFI